MSAERPTEEESIEAMMAYLVGFLAAVRYWNDPPPAERLEARRLELEQTCAEYLAHRKKERGGIETPAANAELDPLLLAVAPFAAAGELLLLMEQIHDDTALARLTPSEPLTVGKLRAVALALRAYRDKLASALDG